MLVVKENNTLDLGYAMDRLVNSKKYEDLDKKEEIEKMDCSVVNKAVAWMEKQVSIASYKRLKSLVNRFFLHEYLVKLACIHPNYDEEMIISYLKNITEETFYQEYNLFLFEMDSSEEEKIKKRIERDNSSGLMKLTPSFSSVMYLKRRTKEIKDTFISAIRDFLPIYYEALLLLKSEKQSALTKYKENFKTKEDFFATYPVLEVSSLSKYPEIEGFVSGFMNTHLTIFFYKTRCFIIIGSGLTYRLSESYKSNQQMGLFKCLSDPTKVKMLHLIRTEDLCASELVEELGIVKSTVSHHIAQLLSANMIHLVRKDGKKVYYGINLEYIKDNLNAFI